MKKIMFIALALVMLFTSVAYAEEEIKVNIGVNVSLPSRIEITGETNLPEESVVDVESSHAFSLSFTEEGVYKFQIKQIPKDDGIKYDETVYDVYVYIVNDNGTLKYSISTNVSGEKEKEIEVSFTNTKERENEFPVIFKKVTEEGEPLKGAKLVLFKGDKIMHSWISGEEPYEVMLPEGLYLLHEESAPDGYLRVKDFDVRVTKEKVEIEEVKGVSISKNVITIMDPKDIPEEPKTPIEKITHIINTGDANNLLLPAGALALSGAGLGALLIVKKRKDKEK